MNYYPAARPGPGMWLDWDLNVIRADFEKMAALHVNVIRLCLQPDAFGYPEPSPKMLGELHAAVDMAAQKGMRVHLTLFFMWHSYTDIAGSKTWAEAVLRPFAHDSRIAFVELHNEIPEKDAAAMTWSRTMLPFLRTIVGGYIPITISVTGELSKSFPQLISALGSSQPDFYDVHLYNNAPIEAYGVLKAAKAVAAAQGRAILIGETGTSTLAAQFGGFPSFAKAQASYEAYQDYYYRLAFLATSALALPPAAPWIFFRTMSRAPSRETSTKCPTILDYITRMEARKSPPPRFPHFLGRVKSTPHSTMALSSITCQRGAISPNYGPEIRRLKPVMRSIPPWLTVAAARQKSGTPVPALELRAFILRRLLISRLEVPTRPAFG